MNKIISISALGIVLMVVVGVIAYKNTQSKTANGQISMIVPSYPAMTEKMSNYIAPTAKTLQLEIIDPRDTLTVTSPFLVVKGKTEANAEVYINDISLIADKDGNFNVPITLEEGENDIVVTANNQNGDNIEKSVTVTYTAPQ